MKVYQFLNSMLYGRSTIGNAVIHVPAHDWESIYPSYVLKCPTDLGYRQEYPSLDLSFVSFSVEGSVLHVFAKPSRGG